MAAGLNADSGWSLAAATLVIAGLLLVPGWVIGRSARLGALPSLAVAPAIGSALIGAAESSPYSGWSAWTMATSTCSPRW